MKKTIFIIFNLVILSCSVFGLSLKTGEDSKYYPVSAPMVANKSGSSSKCFITKIAKANGYPNGTYELELTSSDWVGATVFPVSFTYILKPGDTLELKYCASIYSSAEIKKFKVKTISDNEIVLEEQGSNLGEIKPSEDSL